MADDFIQVAPDSTGKKVDNTTVINEHGTEVYRQTVGMADSETNLRARVLDAPPSDDTPGVAVRMVGPLVVEPMAHASSHGVAGSDAVTIAESQVTGLVTDLNAIADSLATKVGTGDSRLSDARTPTAHAATHKTGGSDAVKLDELSAPTDVTTLNASTAAHGLMPKLPNDAAKFANGVGGYTTPAPTPPGGTTTQIQFNDGSVFNGSANLTFDKVTALLKLLGLFQLEATFNASGVARLFGTNAAIEIMNGAGSQNWSFGVKDSDGNALYIGRGFGPGQGAGNAAIKITTADVVVLPIGQLQFPSTQNPSSNANVLDHYGEQTWTPGIAFGGAAVGVTYTTRGGWYIKVGKVVHFGGQLALSSKGSSVGNAAITGLPYASENDVVNMACAVSVGRYASFSVSVTSMDGIIDSNSAIVSLTTGGAGASAIMNDTHFSNTSQIFHFSGSYRANQ